MTVQVKRFMELTDIVGLRLECKGCGCAISLGNREKEELIDNLLGQAATLHKCPTCQQQWTPQQERQYGGGDSDLKAFFRALRELRKAEKTFGCGIKLEVAGDKP